MTLYTDIQRSRLAVRREDWLPEGFTRILAVGRPDGTSKYYIDTGLRLDPNAEYTVMFSHPGYTSTDTSPVFGGGYSKNDTTFAIWSGRASTGGFSASFGKAQSDAETGYNGGADVTKWHVVRADCRNHSLYCDGELTGTSSKSYVADNASRQYKMVLFGCWRQASNSTQPYWSGGGAVAWFQARSNGVLVRDMVPVLKNADQDNSGSEIGFWDRCGSISPETGTPFYSFSYGRLGRNYAFWRYGTVLPGYRKVAAIESVSGVGRFELTSVFRRTGVQMDYYLPACEGPRIIVGVKHSTTFWPTDGNGGWKFQVYTGTSSDPTTYTYTGQGTFFGRHVLTITPSRLMVDDTVLVDGIVNNCGVRTFINQFWLMGGGDSNESVEYCPCPAGTRVYMFRLGKDSTSYERAGSPDVGADFVPVVSEAEGAVGFVDPVSREIRVSTYFNHWKAVTR